MEFEMILEGIQEIAGKQIAEITQQTAQRIKEIESASKDEAEEICKNLEQQGRIRLNRESALIKQQAEMQYLQNISDARQTLIRETLDQVKSDLQMLRNSKKAYKQLLNALIVEAVEELKPSLEKDEPIILALDSRDEALMKNIMLDDSLNIQLIFDLDCWGGCNAYSSDRKVCVYNTLNDRYKRALPILQQHLSLFFSTKASQGT